MTPGPSLKRSANGRPQTTMSEAHEAHLHLLVCIDRLNNAWRTFQTIKANPRDPLLGPAFRYALVEYATAFTRSAGPVKKRRALPDSLVPSEYTALHKRVVAARHSTHAHADLTALDAQLQVAHFNGEKYVSRVQNHVTGLEELPRLDALISMVETVLERLYALHRASERRITAEP